jgi:hypothetical protein
MSILQRRPKYLSQPLEEPELSGFQSFAPKNKKEETLSFETFVVFYQRTQRHAMWEMME